MELTVIKIEKKNHKQRMCLKPHFRPTMPVLEDYTPLPYHR